MVAVPFLPGRDVVLGQRVYDVQFRVGPPAELQDVSRVAAGIRAYLYDGLRL